MDELQKKFIKEFLNKKNILQYSIYTNSNFAVFNINGVIIRITEVSEVKAGICFPCMLVYAYIDDLRTEEIKIHFESEFFSKIQRLYENYLFRFMDKRKTKYYSLINKLRIEKNE